MSCRVLIRRVPVTASAAGSTRWFASKARNYRPRIGSRLSSAGCACSGGARTPGAPRPLRGGRGAWAATQPRRGCALRPWPAPPTSGWACCRPAARSSRAAGADRGHGIACGGKCDSFRAASGAIGAGVGSGGGVWAEYRVKMHLGDAGLHASAKFLRMTQARVNPPLLCKARPADAHELRFRPA